jgi:O-antigen ligase
LTDSLHRFRRRLLEAFSPDSGGAIDSVAFGLLLLFVIVAPLPYGGVLAGGRFAIEIAAFLIAAGAFLSRARPVPIRRAAIPVAAMLSIAALGLVQVVPLPNGLLSSISPASRQIYHETNEILGLFGEAAVRPRISIAPVETMDVVRLVLADTALFLAAGRLLRRRSRRRLFAWALVGAGIVHVAAVAPRQILEGRVHGAFVNPNHLAAYLEIALACAFGLLWAEVLVNTDRGRGLTERAARVERRFLPLASRAAAWVALATGLALTQSRGGLASALLVSLGLVAVGLSHRRSLSRRSRAVRAVIVFSAVAGVAIALSSRPLLARFLTSDSRDLHGGRRAELWRGSVDAWRQFPVLGDGLGAFREAFRRVQPRELNGLVEQAHSDPLQLLVTGGVVGLALGILVCGSLLVLLWSLWKAQRHREESAMTLAGMGALACFLLHGLVEFPASIPALPAILACVLGMAWAAGETPGTPSP